MTTMPATHHIFNLEPLAPHLRSTIRATKARSWAALQALASPSYAGSVGSTNVVADDAPRGLRRRVVQAVVVVLLFVFATSAAPTLHPSQDDLREWLDPFVDALGLWQGQWTLFGPEADKINVHVVGVVTFADGETAEWRSPQWRELSPLQKFRLFRYMEFTDGIRRNVNRGAWPAFADYVVRARPHPFDPSVVATEIALWRHFVVLPEPHEPLRPISDPFPLARQYRFYQRKLVP